MASDKDLKHNILDQWNWTHHINSAHIGLAAHDGIVTLTCKVEVWCDWEEASEVARVAKGVTSIENDIVIA